MAGQHGKAASFDGVNDYITIPNSASTNISGNALTLSMWINPQPLASGNSVVIGKFWNTTMSSPYYQYGLELGGGNRTELLCWNGEWTELVATAGTTLPYNQWSYLASHLRRRAGPDLCQWRPRQHASASRRRSRLEAIRINIGADASPAQFYKGLLDDLRIYSRVLTQAQIQADMTTPVGGAIAGSPQVLINFPTNGAQVGGIVNVTADATDDTGIANVQFYVDNVATGSPDTTDPYALAWDTRSVSNGAHTLAALATDIDGHTTLSAPVAVNVANGSFFQNEILATGFNLPTAIKFLPDGRMLVVELAGNDQSIAAALYHARSHAIPATDQHRLCRRATGNLRHRARSQFQHQSLLLHLLYAGNAERRSPVALHRECDADGHGRRQRIRHLSGSGKIANAEHHGGAINFGNDGKILLHDRRAFQRRRGAGSHKSARQDLAVSTWTAPYRPTTRSTMARGPITMRYGRSVCATRIRAYYDAPTGPAHHRRRRRQRLFDRDRRSEHRCKGRQLRLAERRSAQRQSRLYGAGLLLSPQWTRRVDHGRVRLSRNAVPEQLPGKLFLCRLHAELDQAPDVRRQRQCQRRLQFRAARWIGRRPLRRHRVSDRRSRRRPLLCRPWLLGYQRHIRRQQDPPHQLRRIRPAAGGLRHRRRPRKGRPRSPSISPAPAPPIRKDSL